MERCSFTLPSQVKKDLSYVAKRVGVGRSALVSEMLGSGLSEMAAVLRALPADTSGLTDGEFRRFRGASVDIVRNRMAALENAVGRLAEEEGK